MEEPPDQEHPAATYLISLAFLMHLAFLFWLFCVVGIPFIWDPLGSEDMFMGALSHCKPIDGANALNSFTALWTACDLHL